MVQVCAEKFGMTVSDVLRAVDPVDDERKRQVLGFLCVDPNKWSGRGPRVMSDFTQAITDDCSFSADKCTSETMAIKRGHSKCLHRYRNCAVPEKGSELCPGCGRYTVGDNDPDWYRFPAYIAIMEKQMECFWVALTFRACDCVLVVIHDELIYNIFHLPDPQYWVDAYVRFVTETNFCALRLYGFDPIYVDVADNRDFAIAAFDKLGYGPTANEWYILSNADLLEHIKNKTLKRPYPWLEMRPRLRKSEKFDAFFRGLPH